jgi:hypothetical protein
MFRCPPVPGINPHTFTESEKRALQRSEEFGESGKGYNAIQSTKVISSIYSLFFIAEKFFP